VRRSSSEAMDVRQLAAAMARCGRVIVTCINFSASAKVEGETGGPIAGAVLKAGGVPGGRLVVWALLLSTLAAASSPREVSVRNFLRDFVMFDLCAL